MKQTIRSIYLRLLLAGVLLLLQQHYVRLMGQLPPISLLQDVLRSTSTWLVF